MDGYQIIGDHSMVKSMVTKDQRRKKEPNKKGGSLKTFPPTNSPPMRKMKNGHHYGGRHSSNQRHRGTMDEGSIEDLEFIEKDILTKEKKKPGHLSLGHLLNFTVTPRDRNHGAVGYNSGGGYKRTRRQTYYNKEQFLQANCQFVVKDGGDYSVHITQSDLLVDWNNIEQVRLFCHEIPSCPVCLYLPTAAKITRCGHVFCSSCILHYLALSDKKWRKCPICYESIYKNDLKSVTTFASKRYEPNDVITMTLMKRKKDTTIVMPCTEWDDSSNEIQLLLDDDQDCRFSKLVIASPSQIMSSVIEPERIALRKQFSTLTVNEESERCFIEAALEDLRMRIKIVSEAHNSLDPDDIQECTGIDSSMDQSDVSSDRDQCGTSPNSKNDIEIQADLERSSTDSDSGTSVSTSPKASPRSEYKYFYQASDGQQLYIHPLNGKALVTEYGDWESCPSTITARIVEIEHHSMTEEEKVRSKYLNHLPLTCEFALCELDIGPPVLSHETLDIFHEQFQKRKQRRQKKKREDKRQEKKHTRNQSGVVLSSDPADMTPEHFHDFLSVASSPPLPSLISTHLKSPPKPWGAPWGSSTVEDQPNEIQQPSFAQALALGDKKTAVTHKPTVQSPVPKGKTDVSEASTLDDEFQEQSVPSFQNSFSSALSTGIQDVLISTENRGGKPGGSKAAKKGRKKIVLFSTAGGSHRV